MRLSRRSFIKWVLSSGAAMACPFPVAGASPARPEREPELRGETNAVCHAVRDGDDFPAPAASLSCGVAIVGGGPSGLAAALKLAGSDFLLLEKEDHFGGNAYAETWNGLDYCTGSAWSSMFSPEVDALFKGWDLGQKRIEGLDSAYFGGKWIPAFWNGREENPALGLLPEAAASSMRRFCREIEPLDLDKDGDRLDGMSFADLLKGHAPELKSYWDCFSMSNWGADTENSSAAIGVDAARNWPREARYTFEGGLGVASRKLREKLSAADQKRLIAGAAVYRVRRKGRRVLVSFRKDGKDQTIEARAVVMATPKFITRLLVEGLPTRQATAMGAMRYAPYLVYNLCFDRVVYNQAYDNFVVGARNFTDFIPADFVTHATGGDLSRRQVITVYAPLRESDRKSLLDDAAVSARARAAVDELADLFPGWADHLAEVRIYRRGHAMPMSTPGWYSRLQKTSRPPLGRVFFAHSDSDGSNSDLAFAALNGIAAAKKAARFL